MYCICLNYAQHFDVECLISEINLINISFVFNCTMYYEWCLFKLGNNLLLNILTYKNTYIYNILRVSSFSSEGCRPTEMYFPFLFLKTSHSSHESFGN